MALRPEPGSPLPVLAQGPAQSIDDPHCEDQFHILPVSPPHFKEEEAQIESQMPDGGAVIVGQPAEFGIGLKIQVLRLQAFVERQKVFRKMIEEIQGGIRSAETARQPKRPLPGARGPFGSAPGQQAGANPGPRHAGTHFPAPVSVCKWPLKKLGHCIHPRPPDRPMPAVSARMIHPEAYRRVCRPPGSRAMNHQAAPQVTPANTQPFTAPNPEQPRTAHVMPPKAANSSVGRRKSFAQFFEMRWSDTGASVFGDWRGSMGSASPGAGTPLTTTGWLDLASPTKKDS